MESLILNRTAAFIIISFPGYLIYRMDKVVKTFGSHYSPGCLEMHENEQYDHCVRVSENCSILKKL